MDHIIQCYKTNLYIPGCDLIWFFLTVFATTAADPFHSSYACYFDRERRTYLGDVYSVNWMQDSDKVSYINSHLHWDISATLTPCVRPT